MVLLYVVVTLLAVLLTGVTSFRVVVRRPATLALLLLLPLGQARQDHALYPADHWGMYSSVNVPRTLLEYLVEGVDGTTYHYPFVDLAFSSPRALMARMSELIARCRCSAGDRSVDRVVEALVELHEDRRGGEIVGFRVYEKGWSGGRRTLRYTWRSDTNEGG